MCPAQATIVPFLTPLIMALVTRTFELLPPEGPKESFDASEREKLLTCFFQFLLVCMDMLVCLAPLVCSSC